MPVLHGSSKSSSDRPLPPPLRIRRPCTYKSLKQQQAWLTLAMEIREASTSAAALSSLLEAMAVRREGDFDGLILGAYHTRSVSTMHDDREAETVDSLEARISGFLCCASLCSFYNAAGQIDEDELAYLLESVDAVVLGWFVCRGWMPMVPSMREKAVCASLSGVLVRLQQQPESKCEKGLDRPLLFGVFKESPDHNGASVSFDKRLFQQLPVRTPSGASKLQHASPYRLVPVSLSVTNLGATKGTRAYEPLASVAGLPRVLSAFPPSPSADGRLGGGAAYEFKESDMPSGKLLQGISGTDVQIQAKGVEALYNTMLVSAATLCETLRGRAEELEVLRKEVDAIY